MKTQCPLYFFIGILLAFGIAGCGGGSNSGAGSHIGEPNDNILEAGIIETGKPIKMKIDSNGDQDWYGVPVPETGYLKVGTKNVPGEVKPEVRFAKKQEWEGKKQKWVSNWSRLPKSIRMDGVDTIYMVVQDNHNDASSSKSFPVKVDFIKEFDEHEPNNEPKNAKMVEFGKKQVAHIYPKGDKEWFKVKVDSAGYLEVKSRTSPGNIKPEVKYAAEDPNTGKVRSFSDHLRLPGAVRVPKKGTYYFMLLDNHDDELSRDPVEWKVAYRPEFDKTEPNDKKGEAYELSIPDTVYPAIFPEGDRDYFTFTPEKDMKIGVNAKEGDGSVKAEVKLWVKTGMEKYETVKGWKRTPTKFKVKKGKEYFLGLQDDHSDESMPEAFPFYIIEQ